MDKTFRWRMRREEAAQLLIFLGRGMERKGEEMKVKTGDGSPPSVSVGTTQPGLAEPPEQASIIHWGSIHIHSIQRQ